MEIRANYTLVGVFAIAVLLGCLVFAVWIAKRTDNVPIMQFDILMKESVSGLSVGSPVMFNGIRVGGVRKMTISNKDPGAVRIRIAVAADTPVREDSVAYMEMRGLAGGTNLSISGGTKESPLVHLGEKEVGKMRSRPSTLGSTFASASKVMDRMAEVLSDDNVRALDTTLKSLAAFSQNLASRSENINNLLTNLDKFTSELEQLTSEAHQIMSVEIKQTSRSVSQAAARLDSTLAMLEPNLKSFSGQGLSDLRMLITEARNLVRVYTRVGEKLENDPRRYLFGEPVKEYNSR